MSFLSTLLEFIFPITTTFRFGAEEEVLESGMRSAEIIAINPANGMPMVGGIGGIDVTGNFWGQSDTSIDHDYYSSVDHFAASFDSSSMFDSGSMFD